MTGADKRASLLSDLLAAKGAAAGDASPPAQPERASVIPIAKHRPSEDRASEASAAPGVLYSKGAATASTFRPSYWSFDHQEPQERAEPSAAPVKVEPAPAPVPAVPLAPPHKSRSLPVNFVVAFGCVALGVSTTLFVLSQWHRGEAPATPAPITIAAAPAPVPAMSAVPLPPPPSAEPV